MIFPPLLLYRSRSFPPQWRGGVQTPTPLRPRPTHCHSLSHLHPFEKHPVEIYTLSARVLSGSVWGCGDDAGLCTGNERDALKAPNFKSYTHQSTKRVLLQFKNQIICCLAFSPRCWCCALVIASSNRWFNTLNLNSAKLIRPLSEIAGNRQVVTFLNEKKKWKRLRKYVNNINL